MNDLENFEKLLDKFKSTESDLKEQMALYENNSSSSMH